MANTGQIVRGIAGYLDAEMLPQMTGLPKFASGIAMGLFLNNAQGALEQYRNAEWAKMIGLVDEAGEYDVPKVYELAVKQLQHEPLVFDIPMLGRVTMRESDMRKLYEHIMNS